jgi:NAD(P)-dependent dehydrogenase (short-subunit alcohol dehydrogenase family)
MTDNRARSIAVVTGAARGLGAAIAGALSEAGYCIAGIDRDPVSLGAGVISVIADLARPEAPAAAIGEVVRQLGRIDVLVNCAGIFQAKPNSEVSAADWDLTLAVNLRAPFLLAQAAAPIMIGQREGAIINVSSTAGLYPRADQAAYGASKAGLEHLTRILALDLAPSGIRVNAVRPGVVDAGIAHENLGTATLDRWARAIPLGRLARPADVAAGVLFLARASHITGHVLAIDGGQTINVVKA